MSGLARGVDACALEGALSVEGGVGGVVLGNGLPEIYPTENIELAHRLVAGGGFVASEFQLDALPLKGHFPTRNRLISGWSVGVVVVAATVRSGSLHTAKWALDQGREVFAVPGPVEGPEFEGVHHLIRDGAHLVASAAEAIEILHFRNQLPRPEFGDGAMS